jgi:hypothetical protein
MSIAVKTIGQTGPRGWGLHTHGLSGGFYRDCTESRNDSS